MTNPKEYKNRAVRKSNKKTHYEPGNDYYSFGLAYEKFQSECLVAKFKYFHSKNLGLFYWVTNKKMQILLFFLGR